MFKMMVVLALLLPGVGGCFWHEGHGRGYEGRGRYEERHHASVVVEPAVHVHRAGCGHVFRAGIWVSGN